MERRKIHPDHVRIAHWISAALLAVMLWSGLAMFVNDRNFAFYVHLIPNPIWSALQLTGHRLQGRAWHLGMAIVLMATAVFYASSSIVSGTWRRIAPRPTWLRDAWDSTVEELTAPRASLQRPDYNGAQRLAYT
ncbi:MAG: cytochrome b/b6 domain-containing protein, partial [Candidatus Eremiobacteraeota bacterium]|nr:cytochrome b/b6 domain-containing protein [Candidatus Eremiobacteraeota bacterium]